ncbi:MAG: hypothetical protein M3P97_11385, partial [Actinomycetota bacterium]|nr:hypothetical protein [Actinomycetota bacterium]
VQEGIVALARCIALLNKGIEASSFPVEPQAAIAAHEDAIRAIRDAYEHIDERALGQIRRGVVDERAFMIFEHGPLVREGLIEYVEHRLNLAQLPAVLAACRTAIKTVAGGPPGH